jgi:16S rRNA U516 pseudouridylate synthase RsuA-like enzyme
VTLQRTAVGGLTLGDLEPGACRLLDASEIERVFETSSA